MRKANVGREIQRTAVDLVNVFSKRNTSEEISISQKYSKSKAHCEHRITGPGRQSIPPFISPNKGHYKNLFSSSKGCINTVVGICVSTSVTYSRWIVSMCRGMLPSL